MKELKPEYEVVIAGTIGATVLLILLWAFGHLERPEPIRSLSKSTQTRSYTTLIGRQHCREIEEGILECMRGKP